MHVLPGGSRLIVDTALVDAFEAERPRLINVAYRLTGSVADAEDAVQESWLRLARDSPSSARRPPRRRSRPS